MARPIWLDFNQETNSERDTPYSDIIVSIGQARRTEDSYYFAIDPQVDPDDESPAKAARVLVLLLKHWLERLNSTDPAYLPVGFSDECMTWLRCVRTGSDVTVDCGWSDDEGWSVCPSAPGNTVPSSFVAIDEIGPVRLYRPRLFSLIRSNIAHLRTLS